MFPSFMGMTAVYLIMVNFELINQLWSLILIYAAGAPMGYLVQKGYFDTITNTIYESAQIDGATNFRMFVSITLPLAKPMIVYTALTQFAWPWSDFILPSLLLKNKDLWTVAVGLTSLDETQFTRFAAGSVKKIISRSRPLYLVKPYAANNATMARAPTRPSSSQMIAKM